MSKAKPFQGSIPPMVTPLTPEEKVDVPAVGRLVRHLIEGGVDGIFALGSMGEGYALTDDQKQVMVEAVVSEVNGRVPVLVGVSDTGTKRTLANAQTAAQLGAAAVVATSPFYHIHYNQMDIADHFRSLAAESGIPLLIYNLPQITQICIELETIERLSEEEGIIGIKDSSGDFSHHQRLIWAMQDREDFFVLIGSADLIAATVLCGADGVVAAIANLAPRLVKDCYQAAVTKEAGKAYRLQQEIEDLLEIYQICKPAPALSGAKAALEMMGLCGPTVHRPTQPVAPEKLGQIRAKLQAHGLL